MVYPCCLAAMRTRGPLTTPGKESHGRRLARRTGTVREGRRPSSRAGPSRMFHPRRRAFEARPPRPKCKCSSAEPRCPGTGRLRMGATRRNGTRRECHLPGSQACPSGTAGPKSGESRARLRRCTPPSFHQRGMECPCSPPRRRIGNQCERHRQGNRACPLCTEGPKNNRLLACFRRRKQCSVVLLPLLGKVCL